MATVAAATSCSVTMGTGLLAFVMEGAFIPMPRFSLLRVNKSVNCAHSFNSASYSSNSS